MRSEATALGVLTGVASNVRWHRSGSFAARVRGKRYEEDKSL